MFWSPLLKMPPCSVSHLTDLQILIVLVLFLVTFHTFSPFSHPFLPWLGQDSFLPPFQLCQHNHLSKKWTPFALWTPYWRVCRLHRKQRSNAQTFVIVKKVCFFVNIFPLAVPEENWTRESEWVPPPDSFLHFLPPKEESLLLYLRCTVGRVEGRLTINPA